jgi:hypothetical protein
MPDFSWYNIPQPQKYSKIQIIYQISINITHFHNTHQMTKCTIQTFTKFFTSRPHLNTKNWDFWYANIPSGNPAIKYILNGHFDSNIFCLSRQSLERR